jgi:hypothetical protein
MGIDRSGGATSGLPRSSHLAAAQTRSNTIMTTPGSDEKGNALFTIRGDIEPKVEVRGFEGLARRTSRDEASRVLVICRPSPYRPPDRDLCFRVAAMQPMSCHV